MNEKSQSELLLHNVEVDICWNAFVHLFSEENVGIILRCRAEKENKMMIQHITLMKSHSEIKIEGYNIFHYFIFKISLRLGI